MCLRKIYTYYPQIASIVWLIDIYFPLYKEHNDKKENISRNTIQRVLAHKQYSCINSLSPSDAYMRR